MIQVRSSRPVARGQGRSVAIVPNSIAAKYHARTVSAYRAAQTAGSTVALPASPAAFAGDRDTTAPQIERPGFDARGPGSSVTVVRCDTAASEARRSGIRLPAVTCVSSVTLV